VCTPRSSCSQRLSRCTLAVEGPHRPQIHDELSCIECPTIASSEQAAASTLALTPESDSRCLLSLTQAFDSQTMPISTRAAEHPRYRRSELPEDLNGARILVRIQTDSNTTESFWSIARVRGRSIDDEVRFTIDVPTPVPSCMPTKFPRIQPRPSAVVSLRRLIASTGTSTFDITALRSEI
jgi:hypothetical protein